MSLCCASILKHRSTLKITADFVLLSTASTFPETAVGSKTCQDSTLVLSLQKLNQQSLPAEKTVSSEKVTGCTVERAVIF